MKEGFKQIPTFSYLKDTDTRINIDLDADEQQRARYLTEGGHEINALNMMREQLELHNLSWDDKENVPDYLYWQSLAVKIPKIVKYDC